MLMLAVIASLRYASGEKLSKLSWPSSPCTPIGVSAPRLLRSTEEARGQRRSVQRVMDDGERRLPLLTPPPSPNGRHHAGEQHQLPPPHRAPRAHARDTACSL